MTAKTSNQTLDRMTMSAVSRMFQVGRHWRAPRHRSACRWARRVTEPAFQQILAMRLSVIFIVTVMLMGSLTVALLVKQRHQTERLAGLEHQVSELQSSLQARESLIEDLRANRDPRSPHAPMYSWAETQVVHQLGEIAQRQSNMMSMLETVLRSPTSVVFPERNPERLHREMMRLEQMHDEEAAKVHEFRSHVQELAEQLRVSDEIGQMDPSTGLDTVSLRAFWPYFEAKRRRNTQERVVETTKLSVLQARTELRAIADGEIP